MTPIVSLLASLLAFQQWTGKVKDSGVLGQCILAIREERTIWAETNRPRGNNEATVKQGSSKYSREHDLAHLVQCTGLK